MGQYSGVSRSDLEYQKFQSDSSGLPAVNVIGEVNTLNTLIPKAYDYVTGSYTTTSDQYIFKIGGTGGTTVATITIEYTGSDKAAIKTVTKT